MSDRVRWLRPLLVFAYLFAFVWASDRFGHYAQDFTIFYAAGTPGPVYDAHWLTSLQPGLPGPRPFAYPPTFLLLLRPLAHLPYRVALSLWAAASGVLFVEATGRLVRRLPWLVLAAPVCAWAAANGQTSLLLGGLAVFGLTLRDRPILAGALLGVACSLKPSVLLLVPLALCIFGEWKAFAALCCAGLVMVLLSLGFGPGLWLDWIRSLSEFQLMNRQLEVRSLGFAGPYWWLALAAVLCCLWAARKSDPPTRITVVLGGGLLISPHAVPYEMAMLAPATLAIIMQAQWRSAGALITFFTMIMPSWGLAAHLAAMLAKPLQRPIWAGDFRRVIHRGNPPA